MKNKTQTYKEYDTNVEGITLCFNLHFNNILTSEDI